MNSRFLKGAAVATTALLTSCSNGTLERASAAAALVEPSSQPSTAPTASTEIPVNDPALSSGTSTDGAAIDLTVQAAPQAILLNWIGGGTEGVSVDRSFNSDECLGNVCTDHLAWVTESSNFVDQDVRANVAYRYKVTDADGTTTGFSEPVMAEAQSGAGASSDLVEIAGTEPTAPSISETASPSRPGPIGTAGTADNLTDNFVRNEPEHTWLDGSWQLEFGDDFSGDRLDETVWFYFESDTHRLSNVCPNNNEGYCEGNNFTPHSSRLDKNHATVSNNALMMDVTASHSENKVQMSFLQTWQDRGTGWETRLQPNAPAAPDGFTNTLFGVEDGPLYIEASVNLSRAYPAVGAWWAFWLYSPDTWLTPVDRWCEGHHLPASCPADTHPQLFERPADLDSGFCGRPANLGEGCPFFSKANGGVYLNYDNNFDATDNNANTGMEVDIFEFAPDVTNDGFNIALYKSHRFDREGSSPNSPQTGLRPHGNHFTAFDTHEYLLSNAGRSYADSGISIDLSEDRYHRLGMYWDSNRYSFYLDGYHMWTVTDQAWITRQRRNGIRMTWEHSHGLWTVPRPGSLPDSDGDGIPQARTFLNSGDHPQVFIDYVKVLRKR